MGFKKCFLSVCSHQIRFFLTLITGMELIGVGVSVVVSIGVGVVVSVVVSVGVSIGVSIGIG